MVMRTMTEKMVGKKLFDTHISFGAYGYSTHGFGRMVVAKDEDEAVGKLYDEVSSSHLIDFYDGEAKEITHIDGYRIVLQQD